MIGTTWRNARKYLQSIDYFFFVYSHREYRSLVTYGLGADLPRRIESSTGPQNNFSFFFWPNLFSKYACVLYVLWCDSPHGECDIIKYACVLYVLWCDWYHMEKCKKIFAKYRLSLFFIYSKDSYRSQGVTSRMVFNLSLAGSKVARGPKTSVFQIFFFSISIFTNTHAFCTYYGVIGTTWRNARKYLQSIDYPFFLYTQIEKLP